MARAILALALTLAFEAMAAESPDAPPSQAASFSGVWVHANDNEEEKARREVIEATVQRMSFFARGAARERLRERTAPVPELELEVDGDRLSLAGGKEKLSLRLGGEPITIERDGKPAVVSARLDGPLLVVSSQRGDGQRETTYMLSPDRQRLTLSIRMIGDRLPGPLHFRATYRRKETGTGEAAPSRKAHPEDAKKGSEKP